MTFLLYHFLFLFPSPIDHLGDYLFFMFIAPDLGKEVLDTLFRVGICASSK